ncbi:MAG TPA: hypothetical protein DFI01_00210 [Bacteroidales bacterium]|nr:hypothetical protein [Bacteroidales bacterium]
MAQSTEHRAQGTGFARCSWPKIAKDWRRGEGENGRRKQSVTTLIHYISEGKETKDWYRKVGPQSMESSCLKNVKFI